MSPDLLRQLDQAIAATQARLLALRNERGFWEGELSSSALSTATAIVALSLVDAEPHGARIEHGTRWLEEHQNADGGWGDTAISKSNLSTTLLCWSALRLAARRSPAIARADAWIRERVGSLEPDAIARAVIARYGKDKTFSVPILMLCTICGTMGEGAWRRVLPLPFELAALPREWFGAIGLPVVSYALPALIAIGHARFFHAPPAPWHPLRWLRGLLWERISPMLAALQPSSGGYLEATPLTSFVTMALACAGERHHPCVPRAVEFLVRSQRGDGSWPIDTNLATWGTTLSVKALAASLSEGQNLPEAPGSNEPCRDWLLGQQYKNIHPFTNAAPGGWAWTDLPGGVPDADDTSGALIALLHLCVDASERQAIGPAAEAGVLWLLDLQNRDGGVPTFCRGWGALPFDRSTPEITAHALWAVCAWMDELSPETQDRAMRFAGSAISYLDSRPTTDWKDRTSSHWTPLWFGNEHVADEENRVFGTAMVVNGLACSGLARSDHWARYLLEQEGSTAFLATRMVKEGAEFLLREQQERGAWGGSSSAPPSIEETALACTALSAAHRIVPEGEPWEALRARVRGAIERGCAWLIERTGGGAGFPAAPIGLYFARLWYHEQLYPVVWTLQALGAARHVLQSPAR